jgi:hypothetical protein
MYKRDLSPRDQSPVDNQKLKEEIRKLKEENERLINTQNVVKLLFIIIFRKLNQLKSSSSNSIKITS